MITLYNLTILYTSFYNTNILRDNSVYIPHNIILLVLYLSWIKPFLIQGNDFIHM